MGSAIAEAFVTIAANMAPLTAGLGTARASLKGFASAAGKAGKTAADALFAPLKAGAAKLAMLSGGALLAGGAAVFAGLGVAIKKAADLNETVSAVEVTFGRAAEKVKADAEKMADAFGVPRKEFLDAAMGIGAIGKASGMTQAEAAELGSKFTKLAIDLGSMRNLPLETALEKIRSGLVGEAEPLRTVGVLLSEAAVQSEALRLKLVVANQELSEGQKIMARASLIARQLSDAHGDLARTAGSWRNQIKELGGRLQNLAEDIGQLLLPAAKALNRELIELINDVKAGFERNKGMFTGWAESLKAAAEWVGVLYRNWKSFLKIAGLKLQDIGKYIIGAFKSVTTFLVDWAKFLAQTIARAIEDALYRAFKGTFMEIPDPSVGRPDIAAPVFKPAEMKEDPDIQREIWKIQGKEMAQRLNRLINQLGPRALEILKPAEAPKKGDAVEKAWAERNKTFETDQAERLAQVRRDDAAKDEAKKERDKRNRVFRPPHPKGWKDSLGVPGLGEPPRIDAGVPGLNRGSAEEAAARARLAARNRLGGGFVEGIPGAIEGERARGPNQGIGGAVAALAKLAGGQKATLGRQAALQRAESMRQTQLAHMAELKADAANKALDPKLREKASRELANMPKLLDEAKGKGKGKGREAEEFTSEFKGPMEYLRGLSTGFLSRGKDPAMETATNTGKIATLLETKLQDGNKILAVADGDE